MIQWYKNMPYFQIDSKGRFTDLFKTVVQYSNFTDKQLGVKCCKEKQMYFCIKCKFFNNCHLKVREYRFLN